MRRFITDVVFSHEDDVYYARYVIKGEKDIKKNHDYTILRQVFDMARDGEDDWVEDRFYEGKKIEDRVDRVVRLGICTMKHETFHGSGYYISTSIKLISITSILHKYYYYINTNSKLNKVIVLLLLSSLV